MAMLRDAYFPEGMLSFLCKLDSSSSSSESSDSDARKKKQKSKSSGTRGTITPGPDDLIPAGERKGKDRCQTATLHQLTDWDIRGTSTPRSHNWQLSPGIFNNFASALHWVLENNYGASLLHYLDDFLLVDPPDQPTCQESMSTMLQQLRLLPDRPQEISSLMMSWLGKRTATKRELLSLIGKLSFAAKVVPAGRLFLRHLIHLSTSVRRLHHHIHLNPEARADLQCWNSFLPSWNGISMFIVPEWKDAESFQLYTDASTSFGFGAYLDGPGSEVTGDHTSNYPSAPYSGRSYLPSSQQLALGVTSRLDSQPAAHAYTSRAGRALEGRFKYLLHRAVTHSTSTTYRAGIRKSKYTINLFAAYLSQALQANTIQVYLAAVTHLYLTHGFSSPAHNNPTLNLAIRGMQRSQGPAHLKPKRLPLTVEMLEQLLRLLDSDPLSRHDRLMLKAALTFGFFGFLRVSEYTRNTRGRFEPRIHPTRNDVSWVKEGIHFLIKKSKTDQTGRGTIISMSYTHRTSCPVMALQADFGNCTAQPRVVLFHFHTGRPLISRAIRAILKDLLLRCGYDTSKYNTHSLRIGAATAAAQAGLPLSTIQRLGRWSSTAYTTYTRIH
eukprot:Em0010g520a